MTSEDQKLTAIYRKESRETSPDHLDRSIRKMAGRRSMASWPSFALAATVLLSFAFILNIGLLQPEIEGTLIVPPIEDMATENAADRVSTESGLADDVFPAAPRQEQEAPAVSVYPQSANTLASPPRASSAADTGRELEEVMQDLRKNREAQNPQDAFSTNMKRGIPDAEVRHCSLAVSASPGSWHKCILALRQEGLHDEADYEQALLLSKFPGFEIR